MRDRVIRVSDVALIKQLGNVCGWALTPYYILVGGADGSMSCVRKLGSYPGETHISRSGLEE